MRKSPKPHWSAGLDQLGPTYVRPDGLPIKVRKGFRARLINRVSNSMGRRKPKITLPKVTLPPIDESAS